MFEKFFLNLLSEISFQTILNENAKTSILKKPQARIKQ